MARALQSVIRQWINGIEVVEATDVQITKPRPVGEKFGARGKIGNFKGQAGGRASITFAQPDDKMQFENFAEDLTDFVYVFMKGNKRWMMTHCEYGDADFRGNMESGDLTNTVAIIGDKPQQVA